MISYFVESKVCQAFRYVGRDIRNAHTPNLTSTLTISKLFQYACVGSSVLVPNAAYQSEIWKRRRSLDRF